MLNPFRDPFMISLAFLIFTGIFASGPLGYKNAQASACCARSSAVPILIVGDDQSQINFGIAQGKVVAETTEEGVPIFGSPDESETNITYRADVATLLSDRFQVGVSVPVVQHMISFSNRSDSGVGLGDVRVSVGYEVIPVWDYSKWKPQGFIFSLVTLPSGRSVYESLSPTASDVTGNGFYSVSVGSLFLKRWDAWDTFFISEIHYSLPRTFESNSDPLFVKPGFGASAGLGVGFSPKEGPVRLGLRIQPRYDQPRQVPSMSLGLPQGRFLSVWDTGFDVSYMVSGSDTLMVSYTDQTLLGEAINSNLNRVFAINFQHRWAR